MNEKELQQKIGEQFVKLPPDLQTVFSSMQWMEDLQAISTTYNLTEEQKATLGTETTLAFLGLIHPSEYESNLVAELGMPREALDRMLAEINTKILNPIRGQLEQVFKQNSQEAAEKHYGIGMPLDERFAQLPLDTQKALSDSNYHQALYDIGLKHKLSIGQIAVFDEVITKVMLGIIHSENSAAELSKALNLPSPTIAELVSEVNVGVLSTVREAMKKMSRGGVGEASDMPVPIPPYKVPTQASSPALLYSNGEGGNTPPVFGAPSNVMKSAGIEMIDSKPAEPEHVIENTETEKSVLYGIEHPVDLSPVQNNSISEKLGGVTAQVAVPSNQSLPKIRLTDPYHEPI